MPTRRMASVSNDTSIDFDAPRVRTIIKLATPTVFAMLLQSIVNEVDVVFFSHLPDKAEASNAQAALFPSLVIVWLFGGSLGAISVGTQALTARRYAEKNRDAAGAVLSNAVWFTLIGGVVLSIVGSFAIPALLRAMMSTKGNCTPQALGIAIAYSRWRILGFVSMATTQAIKGFFDGIGKTSYHFVASLLMNVFNILFCWMFLFGKLGAPVMGAPGAGLAAFASTWIGFFVMTYYAWEHRAEFKPIRWTNLSRSLIWDMLKLSVPAAIATILMMFGFGLFSKIVGALDVHPDCAPGEAVNGAATTDIIEVLKLTFTACIAFGTATATLVSQSMGRKRPDDAVAFAWTSVRLGLMIFGVVGLLEGVVFRRPLIEFISQSPAVRDAMMTPMLIMGIVTPLISVALILSEALFGAGETKFVAGAQGLLVFGWLVPGAWFLGVKMNMGLNGIFTAACVYAVLASVTMTMKFRGGAWKKIVI